MADLPLGFSHITIPINHPHDGDPSLVFLARINPLERSVRISLLPYLYHFIRVLKSNNSSIPADVDISLISLSPFPLSLSHLPIIDIPYSGHDNDVGSSRAIPVRSSIHSTHCGSFSRDHARDWPVHSSTGTVTFVPLYSYRITHFRISHQIMPYYFDQTSPPPLPSLSALWKDNAHPPYY